MLSIVEICALDDPLLLPWLDLYETAFPPGERILVSHVLNVLHNRARGVDHGSHLLAAVQDGDEPPAGVAATNVGPSQKKNFAGIIFDYEPRDSAAAFLWYFAVDPRQRGQGLGTRVYQRLLERLDPQVRALIFDLEDPAFMKTEAAVRQAERRIEFYRRLGARLLGGICYVQTVGPHQPPLPLLLMVHPIKEISPQEAFELAREEFGGEILSQVGELCWE